MSQKLRTLVQIVSRIAANQGESPPRPMGGRRRYRRSALPVLFAISLLGLCSACGGAQAPSRAGSAVMLPASLVVDNQSAAPIRNVHIRPASSEEWGAGLIAPDELIVEGERYTVEGVPPGSWDVRLSDDQGNQQIFFDVYFEDGGTYEIAVTDEGWQPTD